MRWYHERDKKFIEQLGLGGLNIENLSTVDVLNKSIAELRISQKMMMIALHRLSQQVDRIEHVLDIT